MWSRGLWKLACCALLGCSASVGNDAVAPGELRVSACAFSQVDAAESHTCGVVEDDGRVLCWPEQEADALLPADLAFRSVSTSYAHTCGVLATDGRVRCWGDDTHGQATAPERIPFRSVTAGGQHTCALREEDGRAVCWGNDTHGQASPPDGVAFGSIHAGSNYTCAVRELDADLDSKLKELSDQELDDDLLRDGRVECWGLIHRTPVGAFRALGAGRNTACALQQRDGLPRCWGSSGTGQPPPVAFRQVSVGQGGTFAGTHSCGVREDDRQVMCWGANVDGQADAPPGVPFISVSAGHNHSCAIRASDHHLVCWGDNHGGKLIAPDCP